MLSPREAYYGQTEKLTELVHLCRELLRSKPDKDIGFGIESEVAMPLGKVAYCFRHRALRKEAIELLLDYPRKEGLTESLFLGKSSRFIADVEEEGLGDEEYVPHYLATTLVETEFGRSRKTSRLVACYKNRLEPEKMERMETFISW